MDPLEQLQQQQQRFRLHEQRGPPEDQLVWRSNRLTAILSSLFDVQLPFTLAMLSHADRWWLGRWSKNAVRPTGIISVHVRIPRFVPQWETIASIIFYQMAWHVVMMVGTAFLALIFAQPGTFLTLSKGTIVALPFILILRYSLVQVSCVIHAIVGPPYAVHHQRLDPLANGCPASDGLDYMEGTIEWRWSDTLNTISMRLIHLNVIAFSMSHTVILTVLTMLLGGNVMLARACYELVPLVAAVASPHILRRNTNNGKSVVDANMRAAVPSVLLTAWYHTIPRLVLVTATDMYLLQSPVLSSIHPVLFVACATFSEFFFCSREIAVRVH